MISFYTILFILANISIILLSILKPSNKMIHKEEFSDSFDFDFTSLSFEEINNNGGIVSLGICYFKDNKIVKRYYTKVRPINSEESSKSIYLHGITYDSVKTCKTLSELLPEFEDILKKPVVGYKIKVNQLFKATNNKINRNNLNVINAYKLAKKLINAKTYTLYNISSLLQIKLNFYHNALCESEAIGFIYLKLKEIEKQKK